MKDWGLARCMRGCSASGNPGWSCVIRDKNNLRPPPPPPPAYLSTRNFRCSGFRDRHNIKKRPCAELGEEEVVREEEPWVAPEPAPRPSPPIAIGQPVSQTRASPPIAIAPRGPRSPPQRPPARSAEPRFPTGHRGFGESLDLGGFSPGAPPASGSRR